MKRSWVEILSFVITSFAAAPMLSVGPEGAVELLVALDGRVVVLEAEAAAPVNPGRAPSRV